MSQLKQKIEAQAGDATTLEGIVEIDNLILDEIDIGSFSAEDKEYLTGFKNLEAIGLNACKIHSLANFPTLSSLIRVELADNKLSGAELTHLATDDCQIETLKLGANKIASLNDLDCLNKIKSLISLDLEGNPLCKAEGFSADQVFEKLPGLKVFNGHTKDGESVISEDDYDDEEGEFADEYGLEEGEDEMEMNESQMKEFQDQLTDRQKKKLEEKGISFEQFLAGEGDFEFSDEDSEEEDGAAEKKPRQE